MDPNKQSLAPDDNEDSLESPDTIVEPSVSPAKPTQTTQTSSNSAPATGNASTNSNEPKKSEHGLRQKFKGINIYLLGFIFLMLIAAAIVVVVIYNGQQNNVTNQNAPQSLSESQLEQLAGSSETIGNSSQVLNIGANSIFKGQVLVQKDLDVAGNIKIGGSLSLPGISVAGGASFAQIQTNRLTVAGSTTLSGPLVSSSSLDITGTSNFSGPVSIANLSVDSLTLNGTLQLSQHVQTAGSVPSRSTGPAVGSGGTSSVNGTDTAGTLNVNVGGSPSAGCFATIYFAKAYSSTPHVIVTPIGSYAGGLQYYVNRSATNFSICTDSAAPAGHSFSFDYIVID